MSVKQAITARTVLLESPFSPQTINSTLGFFFPKKWIHNWFSASVKYRQYHVQWMNCFICWGKKCLMKGIQNRKWLSGKLYTEYDQRKHLHWEQRLQICKREKVCWRVTETNSPDLREKKKDINQMYVLGGMMCLNKTYTNCRNLHLFIY